MNWPNGGGGGGEKGTVGVRGLEDTHQRMDMNMVQRLVRDWSHLSRGPCAPRPWSVEGACVALAVPAGPFLEGDLSFSASSCPEPPAHSLSCLCFLFTHVFFLPFLLLTLLCKLQGWERVPIGQGVSTPTPHSSPHRPSDDAGPTPFIREKDLRIEACS